MPLPALDTHPARASQATDAHALADFPEGGRVLAERNDAPHHLMPGNARRLDKWVNPFYVTHISPAHAAGLDGDQYFSDAGRRRCALHELKDAGTRDLYGTISRFHGVTPNAWTPCLAASTAPAR